MNNDALIATEYRVPLFQSATNFILDLIILSTLIKPAQYFQIELVRNSPSVFLLLFRFCFYPSHDNFLQVIYWRSSDCYRRFLNELPKSHVSAFVRQKRHQIETTPTMMTSADESTPTSKVKTSKRDVDRSPVDPFLQQTYLTRTDHRQVFKVSSTLVA